MKKVLVLLGAPGSGKGTFSGLLSKYLEKSGKQYSLIEMGEIFRNDENLKNIAASGELIKDEDVIKVFEKYLSQTKNLVILDGFPRTKKQAKYLNYIDKFEGEYKFEILPIKADTQIILKRVKNRRICPKCGKTYNLVNIELMPKTEGICNTCGERLVMRADDQLIEKRLKTFKEETVPAIMYLLENDFCIYPIDSEKIFEKEYIEDLAKSLGI